MLPLYDASKVTASGPGLSSYGIPASLPVEFAVDAKDAGQGLLAVQITVSNHRTKQEWKHVVLAQVTPIQSVHSCTLTYPVSWRVSCWLDLKLWCRNVFALCVCETIEAAFMRFLS